jgi:hypothetical protein
MPFGFQADSQSPYSSLNSLQNNPQMPTPKTQTPVLQRRTLMWGSNPPQALSQVQTHSSLSGDAFSNDPFFNDSSFNNSFGNNSSGNSPQQGPGRLQQVGQGLLGLAAVAGGIAGSYFLNKKLGSNQNTYPYGPNAPYPNNYSYNPYYGNYYPGNYYPGAYPAYRYPGNYGNYAGYGVPYSYTVPYQSYQSVPYSGFGSTTTLW